MRRAATVDHVAADPALGEERRDDDDADQPGTDRPPRWAGLTPP
jgi:hypothetical protein